jgi:hypothetical protein
LAKFFLVSASNVRAIFLVSAEEERLPPVITDALFGLTLDESALAVTSQHTRFKILESSYLVKKNKHKI